LGPTSEIILHRRPLLLFPAFVMALIVYAVIVARGEKTENDENRKYPR
jgi:hypothetical protein